MIIVQLFPTDNIPEKIDEGTDPMVNLLLQKMMFQLFRCYPHRRPIHNQLARNLAHLWYVIILRI